MRRSRLAPVSALALLAAAFVAHSALAQNLEPVGLPPRGAVQPTDVIVDQPAGSPTVQGAQASAIATYVQQNLGLIGGLTGDCTATGPGSVAITCTKSNGTAFGSFAFQNYGSLPSASGSPPIAASTVFPCVPSSVLDGCTGAQLLTYVTGGPIGADPTGAADSTSALQTWLNAGSPGTIPCGTYKTTATLTMETAANNGQQVRGSGAGSSVGTGACRTVIQPTSAVSTAFLIDGTPISSYITSVSISDLGLDMQNMAAGTYGFKQGQSFDIEFNRVRSINDTGKHSFYMGPGAFVTKYNTVQGNAIECIGNGVQDPTTAVLENVDIAGANATYCANFTTIGGAIQVSYVSGRTTVQYVPPGNTNLFGFYSTTLLLAQAYGLPTPNPLTGAILSGGAGYDGGGSQTFANVPLTGGGGTGAQATIVVTAGVVTSWTETAAGTGYANGDLLSASSANLGGSGSGLSIQISPGLYIALSDYFSNMQGLTAVGTDWEQETTIPTACATGGSWSFGSYNDGTHGCLPTVWALAVQANVTGCSLTNITLGGEYLYEVPSSTYGCTLSGRNQSFTSTNYITGPTNINAPFSVGGSYAMRFYSDLGQQNQVGLIDTSNGNIVFRNITVAPGAAGDGVTMNWLNAAGVEVGQFISEPTAGASILNIFGTVGGYQLRSQPLTDGPNALVIINAEETGELFNCTTSSTLTAQNCGIANGGALNFFSDSFSTLKASINAATGAILGQSYAAGAHSGVTCSGTPTSSFAVTNGIVTHC